MTFPLRVKERTVEQSPDMNADQQSIIRILANELHRLNYTIMKAVDAGVSIELSCAVRHHNDDGNWGDLLVPVIHTNKQK